MQKILHLAKCNVRIILTSENSDIGIFGQMQNFCLVDRVEILVERVKRLWSSLENRAAKSAKFCILRARTQRFCTIFMQDFERKCCSKILTFAKLFCKLGACTDTLMEKAVSQEARDGGAGPLCSYRLRWGPERAKSCRHNATLDWKNLVIDSYRVTDRHIISLIAGWAKKQKAQSFPLNQN